MAKVVGGIEGANGSSENTLELNDLGRFAVEEHNKKANALLEFERVVDVKKQVVAGTIHHLVLETKEGGEKKYYEAKVWEKAWMNFKELQEFKPVEGPTST